MATIACPYMSLASETFWEKFESSTILNPSKTAEIKLNASPLTETPSETMAVSPNTTTRMPPYEKAIASSFHRVRRSEGISRWAIIAAHMG